MTDLASRIRQDFPILQRKVHNVPLVYLDNGASSQRPVQVITAMDEHYRMHHANIHRGAHTLGEESTQAYESAREKVAGFVNAPATHEIIFTKNATEAFNLVASSCGRFFLSEGDRILISAMEHHANIVPWFMVAEQTGAKVDWIPLTSDGQIDLEAAHALIPGAKIVACTAVSNVLGTINPIAEICAKARESGAVSVVDAAQLAPHLPIDVQALGCDFLGFTGHKMCGPTGIGVLWGRTELLDAIPPFLGGGEMIEIVDFEGFTTAPLPYKFEAGTMPIAEAIGLATAIDYLTDIGFDAIRKHEVDLLGTTFDMLTSAFGDKIRIYGPQDINRRSGILSFNFGDIHPHDLASILDAEGVAIRAGHHCAQPLMRTLGVQATARASFYFYNTKEEVEILAHGLEKAADIFGI